MLAVTVTFQYGADFDRTMLEKIASEARGMFEGMPGLRSKAFTVDEAEQRAVNFYIWNDEAAGRSFFNDDLRQRVTGLYGVAPAITFAEVAELVENK